MKPPLDMRYLVLMLFALLALVGCSRKPDYQQSEDKRFRDYFLHAQADALYTKIVLTDLRDGQTTNALELLEMQIDTSIITIDHSLSHMSGWEREDALGTLRVLKAYREAHPRQREAVLQDAEKADLEINAQGAKDASRILSNLK